MKKKDTDRVTMHHPDTGAEIDVTKTAQKHLVQSGWVAGKAPEQKTSGKAPGDNVSGEQKK